MVQREPLEAGSAPAAPVSLEDVVENKQLVDAFKRGEDGSYRAIHERYSARVTGICRRMLDHSHDAEEAQQETFVRIYAALPNFNGRYQLGAWVSRIATNVCLDHLRSKGRKPADSTDHATLVDLSDDSADGPEEIFMKGDERQRVRAILSDLAPMHRAALALREFEGMSYADIAVALGMTEPQVKALIHRARRSFKKRWAHGFALLLPWRLLARLRRFSSHYDTPPHLTDMAASTANFASSCSAALQQCGAFVTDKAASAFTALIVGTAAVGVAVAPTGSPAQEPKQHPVVAQSVTHEEARGRQLLKHPTRKKKDVGPVSNAGGADPVSEPEPEPQATPSPAAEDETPSQEPAQPTPSSQPTYGPLAPAIGWDRGSEIPATAPVTESTQVSCSTRQFAQRVESVIHDGASSYPAVLQVWIEKGSPRLDLSVTKNGRTVTYSGGAPELVVAGSGRETAWGFTGSYSWYGAVRPDEVGLPLYGRFTARLSLDCFASVVITESLLFTTE